MTVEVIAAGRPIIPKAGRSARSTAVMPAFAGIHDFAENTER